MVHPERGVSRADQFIPLAEETGLIVRWVWALETSLRQAERGSAPSPDGPAADDEREPLASAAGRAHAPQRRGSACCMTPASSRRHSGSRSPRAHSHRDAESALQCARRAAGPGSPSRGRRLRYGLLVAGVPRAVAGRGAEDRSARSPKASACARTAPRCMGAVVGLTHAAALDGGGGHRDTPAVPTAAGAGIRGGARLLFGPARPPETFGPDPPRRAFDRPRRPAAERPRTGQEQPSRRHLSAGSRGHRPAHAFRG